MDAGEMPDDAQSLGAALTPAFGATSAGVSRRAFLDAARR